MKKRQKSRFSSSYQRLEYQRLESRQVLTASLGVLAPNDGGLALNDFFFDLDRQPDVEIDREFGFSSQTEFAVSGDWDGNGSTDVGIIVQDGAFWRWLLDTDGDPEAEINTIFGLTSDIPVVGDWDGDGTFTPGVARPEGGSYRWLFDSDFDPEVEDGSFIFGGPFFNDIPVTGDWDGDGVWDVGVARPEGGFLRWFYDTDRTPEVDGGNFIFGLVTDAPITGDWDGDGTSNAGVTRPVNGFLNWFMDTNEDPNPESEQIFGLDSHIPIVGNWSLSELSVTSAGVEIPTVQSVDLGNGLPGELPSSRTFQVRNVGSANLELSDVVVPNGFLLSGLPGVVAPGSASNFTISRNPNVFGVQDGLLTFATNDGNERVFQFDLSEFTPELQVDDVTNGGEFDFGIGFFGQDVGNEFTITNSGSTELILSAPIISGPFFVANGFPSSIAPGASSTFPVSYTHLTLPTKA